MSAHETDLTLWYWQQLGGMLFEEFMVVPKAQNQARRLLDGLIVLGEPKQRMPVGAKVSLDGKDVVVVQTKNSRLGMYLMGQTLFSLHLVRKFFSPRSARSVALCAKSDAVLQPMLEAHEGCQVVVCPPAVCQLTSQRILQRTGRVALDNQERSGELDRHGENCAGANGLRASVSC